MVVDPGCMKCMDCVSVCPNDALYFGFGKTAATVKKTIERNYSLTWPEEVAAALGSDPAAGLAESEARSRLELLGRNELPRPTRPDYARIALRQVADPLVALLVAAAAVSFAIGEGVESGAIAAIVVLNAAFGFWQEVGAARAVVICIFLSIFCLAYFRVTRRIHPEAVK